MTTIYFLLDLSFSLFLSYALGEPSDYCHNRMFQPSCENDEIIIMSSALYGRMNLGQCVPRDLGFIGCSTDVLSIFDEVCSGHSTCSVQINDENIDAPGGCFEGLKRYLEADFDCHKALTIDRSCSSMDLNVESDDILLSSVSMRPCLTNNRRRFTLSAKEGQLLNISLISLSQIMDVIYGTIQDESSGSSVVFGNGAREQHIMSSTGNAVSVTMQDQSDEVNFILRIQVSGCPDITPPDGAWMIRDGNQMEIGCHLGAKSWTLKCESTQWVGALGLCGSDSGSNAVAELEPMEQELESISLDVLMFAGSSVIILISAVIFLVGVCILRRKLQPKNIPTNTNVNYPRNDQAFVENTLLRPGNVSSEKDASDVLNTAPAYTMYANTAPSDADGSVQYFVLEDQQ